MSRPRKQPIASTSKGLGKNRSLSSTALGKRPKRTRSHDHIKKKQKLPERPLMEQLLNYTKFSAPTERELAVTGERTPGLFYLSKSCSNSGIGGDIHVCPLPSIVFDHFPNVLCCDNCTETNPRDLYLARFDYRTTVSSAESKLAYNFPFPNVLPSIEYRWALSGSFYFGNPELQEQLDSINQRYFLLCNKCYADSLKTCQRCTAHFPTEFVHVCHLNFEGIVID